MIIRFLGPRSAPAACLAFLGCLVASCSPNNPFDPATPADLQQPGSLTGTVVLDDVTAPADALALERAAVRVALTDEATGKRVQSGGEDLTVPLKDVEGGAGDARFTFVDLVPGLYRPQFLNVGARYTRPDVGAVRVLPGDAVDAGEFRFVAVSVNGAGPGLIEGEAQLVDADGGARTVSVFRLLAAGEAPQLAASVLTKPDGTFSIAGLPIGTYAVVGSLTGFTDDYKLDLTIGETDGASLSFQLQGNDALQLHPITAVLRPDLPIVEGHRYVAGDSVDLDVLAFGGVTAMRLGTDPAFVDEAGVAADFVPYSATAPLALPDVEGPIPLFGQFQIESQAGFVFTSDVFSSEVIRDVSAPEVVSAAFLGGVQDGGVFLANSVTGPTLTLRSQLQDAVSAVAALAIVVTDGADDSVPTPDSFTDLTSNGGLISRDDSVPLGADGAKHVFVFARDRAGNTSAGFRLDALLDRTAPDVPLTVVDAVGASLPVRDAQLRFDESAATTDLPVAMQIGVHPLSPSAPIVPYVVDPVVFVDPTVAAHGETVSFDARLFDRAGNSAVVSSATLTLDLVARVTGVVDVEGVPEIDASAAGAVVSVVSAGGAVLNSATTDAAGAFTLDDVVEGTGLTLRASRAGSKTVTVSLGAQGTVAAQRPGAAPVDAGTVALPLARGTVAGRFRLADLSGDDGAHAGITVTASLAGSARAFQTSTVTGPTGDYAFAGLPANVAGERYVLDARFADYGSATAEITAAADAVTVVNAGAGGGAIAVLLPRNVGDFDVCGPSGACTPAQFLSAVSARVKLRDATGVADIRVQARAAFAAGDAAPAFVPFDVQNATPVDISGVDGLVDIFVQVKKSDGTVGPVLSTTIVKDTVAPALVSLTRQQAPGALDARFTKNQFVDVVVRGDPGTGNVAPLATARAVVAATSPAAPPGNATPCSDSVSCRVALPGADTNSVVEQLHNVFAFSCDAAGNCSAPSAASQTFVIFDVTPPAAANGAGFTVTGTGVVQQGNTTVLPSTLYTASLAVGTAKTGGGAAVVDNTGAAVPDVFAYRFSLTESTADALVRALDPAPSAGQARADLVLPGLPAVDGSYTLFAQLVDGAGNTTNVAPNAFLRALKLDTTPPDATFTLNSGALITTSPTVSFKADIPVGGEVPATIAVAADGGLFQSGVVNRTFPLNPAGEPFTLPSRGDGNYVVFARIADVVGNRADRSAQIVLDTTPPDVLLVTCRTCTTSGGVLFTQDNTGVILDVNARDLTSAVTQLDVSVNGGAAARSAFNGSVQVPLALNATNTVVVKAVDAAGLVTSAAGAFTLTIKHDNTAPVVTSVVVNGNNPKTNNVNVSVAVAATDANGIAGMRLSTTTSFSGPVLPFSSPTSFTLSGSDGTKQVCVEVTDGAGKTANACDNIDLDRQAPVGSVVVAAGAASTKTTPAAVALTYDLGTTAVAVSTAALDCTSAAYTTVLATSTTFNTTAALAAPDGQKTVFACFRDDALNTSAASDDVVFDTTPPAASIVVNNNAAFATSLGVTVQVTQADAVRMSVLEAARVLSDCNSAVYENIASTKSITLANTGDTLRTVSACFEDAAGNRAISSDTITVDQGLPSGTVRLSGTILGTQAGNARTAIASSTLTRTPFISVSMTSPSADAAEIMISEDSAFVGAVFQGFVPGTQYPLQLSAGDGTKTVFVKLRDLAGNVSANLQSTITLDTTAPTSPTILVDGGKDFTNDAGARVTLTLSASSAPTEMTFSTNGDFSTPTFETFAVTKSAFQLTATAAPAGDGLKTVFAVFRDAAGNESAAVNDSITVDRVAPAPVADVPCGGVNKVVCVNGGATFTNSVSVTLSFTASVVPPATSNTDKATEMQVATDGAADTEPFIPYSPTLIALLAAGDCTAGNAQCKTVAVKFRDAAGNTSAAFTDTIGLDSTTPNAPRIANADEVTSASNEVVTLSVAASDAFGVTYQLFGGQFADWTNTASTDNFAFVLTSPSSASAETGDVFNLGVRAVDPAGNISAEDFVTVICDGNSPAVPTGLSAAERSGSVSLRWNRAAESDVVGYLVFYGYDQSVADDFAAEGPSPIFVPMPGGSAAPSITLTGLADNTPFFVTVAAIDHATAPQANISPATSLIEVLPNEVTPLVVSSVARVNNSTFSLAADGGRVVAMKGAQLCVYDATDPHALTEIVCKTDASFNAADNISVFGRFAYLYRNGASTRVVDIGKLAGSQRANPNAGVAVTTLGDANTTNIVDMSFFGTVTSGNAPFVAVTRITGAATSEMRLLQLPAASAPLAGDLGTSATANTSLPVNSANIGKVDATPAISAVIAGGLPAAVLTKDLRKTVLFRGASGTRDVKVETFGNGTGRMYMAGTFGVILSDVTFVDDPSVGSISLDTIGTRFSGFDCSHLEVAAGYLYCNDISTSTAETIVVIALSPLPHLVGRLLFENTKTAAAPGGAVVPNFTMSDTTIYAAVDDGSDSLAAVEIVRAGRYEAGSSIGQDFDEVLVDHGIAYAIGGAAGQVEMPVSIFNLDDPALPTTAPSLGSMGTNCDSSTLRHSRGDMFGRTAMVSCEGQSLNGLNIPFVELDSTGRVPATLRSRPSTNLSKTRGFAVQGNTAYVLTNDSKVEVWALGRQNTGANLDGPVATLTLAGAPSLSRPPAVQDDRLIVLDDTGKATVINLANTTAATPTIAAIGSPFDMTAPDSTRFGDTDLRGTRYLVTRPLTDNTQNGMFAATFNPVTGVLSGLTARKRGFGAMAQMGDSVMAADGFFFAGATPGDVAGVLDVGANLSLISSSQAALSPFGVVVSGPALIGVNRDGGLETLILSR